MDSGLRRNDEVMQRSPKEGNCQRRVAGDSKLASRVRMNSATGTPSRAGWLDVTLRCIIERTGVSQTAPALL